MIEVFMEALNATMALLVAAFTVYMVKLFKGVSLRGDGVSWCML